MRDRCLLGSRFTMTAYVMHLQGRVRNAAGQYIKQYDRDEIQPVECMVRGVVSDGIRVVGSTERFSQDYEDIEWAKMTTTFPLSKDDRIVSIEDSNGVEVWEGEFDVMGATPLFDAFNNFIEYDVLLRKADNQNGEQ